MILSRVRVSVTSINGFWIGWFDLLALLLQLFLITINNNSSKSVTAEGSPHSLLDYECLLFHCDWLGSDLRVDHFFSFRCPLVNTPQLNTQLSYERTGWRPQCDCHTNAEWTLLYNSSRTDERPPPPTVRVLVCFIRCHGNVLTEPLSGNGLFRVHWLLCKRVLILWQPKRCVGYVPSEPLPSNGRLLWLRYSGFQPSCHNMLN
jgi:hypothetical protein